MKRKGRRHWCYVLLMVGAALSSCARDPETAKKKQLEAIEKELSELDKQLHGYRLKEMNIEIEGQNNFLEEWPEFAKDMKEAEKMQNKETQIEKRINELLIQKQALLEKPMSP